MGYSPEFVKNYTQIMEALQDDEELPIEVTTQMDAICGPCPYNKGAKCTTEEKSLELDARHSQVLGITHSMVLTWREAQERMKEAMTMEAFHYACKGCSWKAFGVCEAALKKLRNQTP